MTDAFALNIAGVNIKLSLDAELGSPASTLSPFLSPGDSPQPPALAVEVLRQDEVLTPALPDSSATMSVHPHDGGLAFYRPGGTLVSSPDFSFCRVHVLADRPPPEPFDGRPWLLLALWGHVAHRGGALLHGAVCELEGHFVVFLGKPGAGKSTLGELVVAAGGTCLTDEYPVLTWREERAWAHGTPWRGICGPGMRLSGPLEGVFFLRHAPANELERLGQPEGGRRLLQNARFFVWQPDTIPQTVELLDRTARSVPIYDFGFVPEASAVECLREALRPASSPGLAAAFPAPHPPAAEAEQQD